MGLVLFSEKLTRKEIMMNIQHIEKLLNASHVGSYKSGNMGSKILRFRSNADGTPLVLKFAPLNNSRALEDLQANIRGYNEIKSVGGQHILPTGLKEISIEGGKALVMYDLGNSMRVVNDGFNACVLLWKHFKQAILQTAETNVIKGGPPDFISEIIRHIRRFSHGNVPDIILAVEKYKQVGNCAGQAIMLLDFTPDNLVLTKTKLSFIDPWSQGSFLGHPAVSIGQFCALMRVYGMKDAEKSASMLKECCIKEIPPMIGCDTASVEFAFRLGSTLDLVLTSYERQKEAYELWM